MRIQFRKRFKKKFDTLPDRVKERFYERLVVFQGDPFHPFLNNHAVDRAYPDCRSINVTGDYRAIFYTEEDTIFFVTIGTHSDLYG